MANRFRFVLHPLALAALVTSAHAQLAGTLPAVTIREGVNPSPSAELTGFGDQPLASSPLSARVITADAIANTGARRLSDLYALDSSLGNAYNAVGYVDYASVRGFVIDNSYNFRREGLPISGETSLPLEHLARVELLKGTSGIQAGTSAPGGLFNATVKRPTTTALRTLRAELTSEGAALLHADIGGRSAVSDIGYRLNIAGERLNNEAPGTEGRRGLFALALDARPSADSLIEAEFEVSRRQQPSVPGQSLLGNTLPAPDPGLNLNTQPWTQPVDFRNVSGSLRYTQAIDSRWSWQAQLGTQRLKTDDFLAYPYGCDAEGVYDRYCSNGDVDIYDYRSLNEQRRTHAAQWRLNGRVDTGALRHQVSAGVLISRFSVRGQDRSGSYPPAGQSNVFNPRSVPERAVFDDPFTQRTERSTEWFATDVIDWTPRLQTWLGLRHTRLDRDSVRTDGSRATAYGQRFTTPWLASAFKLDTRHTLYASWGQGIESEVVEGRARYTNAGEALPALKSRQWEIGLKAGGERMHWQVSYFDIARPVSNDRFNGGATDCDDATPGSCTRLIDGEARHRGIELGGGRRSGAWAYDASVSWLDAERRGSTLDPSLNGLRPTNVPRWVLRANLSHQLAALPGLHLGAHLSHEGRRAVLPDNSLSIGAWTRVDASLRYTTQVQGRPASWTLAIHNLFDRRYFQEAPYQYGHVYLFPGASRSLRLAFETNF